MIRIVSGLVIALALGLATGAGAQPVPVGGQDPLAGARVFGAKGCTKCHAVGGVGGKIGPDLAKISRPRTFFDLASAMWNHLPRMADRMKQLGIDRPKLDGREAGDLVGFLYTLNYFDSPGSPEVGKRLFSEKRCIVCHTAGGAGGVVGPNLDFLRQFASPVYLAAALWNHGPQMAQAMKERGIERPTFTGSDLRDLAAFLAPATAAPREGALYVLPGRSEQGRVLFADRRCIECHSVGGVGGKVGPDLVSLGVRRSPMEFAAVIWNKAPAMASAMQARGIAIPALRPEDMADLVAYLYSVRYFGDAGDIQKGWAVATQKGCLHCHGVSGERGKPAGDLTRYKGLESAAGVIAGLWNHTLVTPTGPDGKKLPWPELTADEMKDLVALLQSFGQAQRPKR